MRKVIIILEVSMLLFASCTTNKRLIGNYNDERNIGFVFSENPNKFEYNFRSEMGIHEYSTGSWLRYKNKVVLNGFADSNIKFLNIEQRIVENSENRDKITIHYTAKNEMIKSDIIINNCTIIRLSKDTSFFSEIKIKSLEIKSYLSYTGLLGTIPTLDTLYSSIILVDKGSNKNRDLFLKFAVRSIDFFRTKLTDTITVRNKNVLMLNKIKLRKVAD